MAGHSWENSMRSLFKRIVIVALPASAQFMISYVQLSTDMAFIGHYDPVGLSAIHNVRSSFILLLSFLVAFTNGTRVQVARAIGAGRPARVRWFCETSLVFTQLASFLYLVLWQVGGRTILRAMGTGGPLLAMGWTYLRVLSLMFVFHGTTLAATAIHQGRGKTGPVAIAALLRAGINIPLDWVLIYGRLGFPELGIAGAAVSTLVSELIGGAYIVAAVLRDSDVPVSLKNALRTLRSRGSQMLRVLRKIAAVGIPSGLESMAWNIGNVGILAMLNRTSPMAAGYYGVLGTIKTMSVTVYFGLGVGVMSLVAMAVGANDNSLGRRTARAALLIALTVCAVIGPSFILFGRPLLGLFVSDPTTVDQLVPLLPILSVTLFPQAFNVISGSSLIARGEASWFLRVQVTGTALLAVLSYIALFRLKLGLAGLLFAVLFDEVWRAVANSIRLRVVSRD